MSIRALRLLAALALAAGVVVTAPAGAGPVPEDATWSEAYIPNPDGTKLHADVFLPENRKSTSKHPVILSIGPYYGSGSQNAPAWDPMGQGPSDRFNDLIEEGQIFKKGYALILVDSRGYGSSGGCNDFGGPGEQSDAKAAVEWAARQPWSNGKVGMWGKSYDAWTQVMALATKPKGLAATVIQAPLIEAYRAFFENGVHYAAGWYITPALYADYDLTPPTVNDDPMEWVHAVSGTATNPHCYAGNLGNSANPDHSSAHWRARDLIKRAGESKVPTLWSHGFNDINTKPTNIFPVYGALKGPKRAWFGQWAHDRGNEVDKVGRAGFMAEAMNWFDHYLRGKPLKKAPPVEIQDGDGVWRDEKSWPPSDSVMRRMRLLPGSWADEPGNNANTPDGGTWSVSQPAPYDVRLAGLMRFNGQVSVQTPAGGNLVALVYDVNADGESRLMSRGAIAVSGDEDVVSFDLWPQDWLLRKGHRIAVQLSADDSQMYLPTHRRGSTVTLESGELLLPILRKVRTRTLAGEEAQASGSVPTPTLTSELEGRETRADFGPRPTR
ncbi:MAG TPA: CocE/NonD family hydrolase [Mycobacteriales bacterium]|nr:CocE/NonD family hydrolase [Mycobacteriales bacterium]